MTDTKCPSCLNGCGGVRSDCPQREGGPLVRPAIGRPSSYTEDVGEIICTRLAQGESLRKICEDPSMPGASSVFRWLQANEGFREQYAHAREVQGHMAAERAVDEALAAEDAARGRLKFDALKWQAAKQLPKVYGDKITQEHTGPGGGPVATVALSTDPIEAAREYRVLMGME